MRGSADLVLAIPLPNATRTELAADLPRISSTARCPPVYSAPSTLPVQASLSQVSTRMIEIISATRLSEAEFWGQSALGISLRRLAHDTRLVAKVAYENRRGLPEVYNERIETPAGQDGAQPLLVFMHDDVWIDDVFFADRIIEGLKQFDVLGVAGNRRRAKNQPNWAYPDTRFEWDERSNISGAVAHGKAPFGMVSYFGPVPAECELLDGVLLAARKDVLLGRAVRFDPLFNFHFYDQDFCRTARNAGLKLATWPISITHQSEGGFAASGWLENFKVYLRKWGE